MSLPLMDISPYLHATRVLFFDQVISKQEALERLAECAAQSPVITDTKAFLTAIFEREQVSSTGIGRGVAVPHAKIDSIKGFAITIGISQLGIDYAAIDGAPVHVLLMIAATDLERKTYLQLLATVANQLKQASIYQELCHATSCEAVFSALAPNS